MTLKVDGGILAGGLSSRMNGQDKGLQSYNKRPMVSWIIDALQTSVDKLYINCNRNISEYKAFGFDLCQDIMPYYQGPLAGIHSLLNASNADYLLISPCDTPNIAESFPKRMLAELKKRHLDTPNQALLLAATFQGKHHPLHMCISSSYINKLKTSLNNGERKVMRWLEDNNVSWIDFSDADSDFSNLNSLDSLKQS